MEADFSGYVTRNDIRCSDGRTIKKDAFAHMDGVKVPLVWQHIHDDSENVLGHVLLENRQDGVYGYGFFNDTPKGQVAKTLVKHGDVDALSIYANKLVEKAKNVVHGFIREVSLVLSGANPGAFIDQVNLQHGDDTIEELADEAIIHTGLTFDLSHEDQTQQGDETVGKTMGDILDTFNEDQKAVLFDLVGEALARPVQHSDDSDDTDDDSLQHQEDSDKDDSDKDDSEDKSDELEHKDDSDEKDLQHKDKEGRSVKTHNVFDRTDDSKAPGATLTHSQLMTIVDDAKKSGSWKEAFLAHADDYGITNIEMLFPEARSTEVHPEWITRKMEWVSVLLNACRKLPYAKIKSMSADLTHEEARAKGYIKGNVKKEQFFAVAKRETGPKTIYKKQKLDRDDMIDITDFDIVMWLWGEMRFMLNEEIARAILIGDGREIDDEDKIDETKIRPIAQDDDFYTDVVVLASNVTGDALIEAVLRNRPKYKGTGQPWMFCTEDVLTDLILLKDKMGRRLYPTQAELESALRVSKIVTVPVMDGVTTDDGLLEIVLVNPADYSIGTNSGGQITTFDDFDIDYNQYKYLIEGRMSGALTKHKTAQVFVRSAGTLVSPEVPTFVAATGVVTIPATVGVVYYQDDVEVASGAQAAVDPGVTTEIVALPADGYYFPHNIDTDWTFTRDL